MTPCIRRYTFKLYPNVVQAAALDRVRRMHCALYNATLQERIDQYRHEVQRVGKASARGLTCYDQQKALKLIRADDPEWRALSSDSMTVTLERVDRAFQAFFRRARAGAGTQSGYPRFQSAERFTGFGFKKHRSGWRFDAKPNGGALYLKGVPGTLKARGKFPATPDKIKTCDILLRAGTWWLSVVVEMAPRLRAQSDNSGEVVFDLVDHFAAVRTANGGHAAGPEETVFAAADGRISPMVSRDKPTSAAATPETGADRGNEAVGNQPEFAAATPETGADRGSARCTANPQQAAATPETGADRGGQRRRDQLHGAAATPETLQQAMARCRRGSSRYRALRTRKARLEAKVARRRREALHVWTTVIARRFHQLRIVKPASIAAATASGHGDARAWGAQTELKATFNRHVLGQAPAAAIQMLEYKIAERGGRVETAILDTAPVEIGNLVVAAQKSNRKLKQKASA